MNIKIQNIINEELAVLPKELKDIINIFEWDSLVEEIGKKHNLTPYKIFTLQIETALVLIGLVAPNLYIENIEQKVGVNQEEAKKITMETNQKIFTPMMNKLNETIKNNLPNRNIHWQQNLNFILSGGDYTAFIKRIEETKDEIPKPNESFNPSKMDDLKSKFTI